MARSHSCVCTSPEFRGFYPGSPHHVKEMWLNEETLQPHFPTTPWLLTSLGPPLPTSPPSCGTASNIHNWPPYWASAKALIRPWHTLVGVSKHTNTHTHSHTHIDTGWRVTSLLIYFVLVFKWRLTRWKGSLTRIKKHDVKSVFSCTLTSCTKSLITKQCILSKSQTALYHRLPQPDLWIATFGQARGCDLLPSGEL